MARIWLWRLARDIGIADVDMEEDACLGRGCVIFPRNSSAREAREDTYRLEVVTMDLVEGLLSWGWRLDDTEREIWRICSPVGPRLMAMGAIME